MALSTKTFPLSGGITSEGTMAEDRDKDKPQKVRILSDCIISNGRIGIADHVYEVEGPNARLLISYGKAEPADDDAEVSPEFEEEHPEADGPGTVHNRDPKPARGRKK